MVYWRFYIVNTQFVSQGYLVLWQEYNTSLLAVVDTLNSGTGLSWSCDWDSQGLKVIVVALSSGTGLSWSCDWDSQVLKVSSLVTNSLVTDWVQFESWPSVVYITLALKFLKSYSSEFLAQCYPTLSNQDLYTESQLPIVLDVSLPPGLLGHPRSSHIQDLYTQVPASCCPWCKPSPWTHPGSS